VHLSGKLEDGLVSVWLNTLLPQRILFQICLDTALC